MVERAIEEMSLQVFPKQVNDGADMTFCGSVPQPGSSEWKRSVADGLNDTV